MTVMLLICIVPITSVRSADTCLSATGEAAVNACRSELLGDPGNVDIRLALGDAFMTLRRYADAVAVLREGFEYVPGDERIKQKLTLAESYLDEQRWIEKQQQDDAAASRAKGRSTQVRLSLIRCSKLSGEAALAACNEGLDAAPEHPELLVGRGRVWLEMERLGYAIRDFESALVVDPKNREAAKQLRLAQTRRTVKVTQCLDQEGPVGLAACDAALMPGATDAFTIQKRRAVLLQAMGREKEALDGYRAAERLNRNDRQVKQALASLSPQTAPPVDRPSTQKAPAAAPAGRTQKAPSPPLPKKPAAVESAVSTVRTAPVPTAPPLETAPAKMAAPPKKTPAAKIAAVQPRQYSNAPLVPGITH